MANTNEAKVVNAVTGVIEATNNGADPTDALCKAAVSNNLSPEFVRRLAEVYNTSKVLSHFQTADPMEKGSSFPLADAQKAIDTIWPKVTKAATATKSVGFETPQTFDTDNIAEPMAKAAFLIPPKLVKLDPAKILEAAYTERRSLKEAKARADIDTLAAKSRIVDFVKSATEYFAGFNAIPFDVVEANAVATYGDAIKPVLDMVAAGISNNVKRASAKVSVAFDVSAKPYVLIKKAMDEAAVYAANKHKADSIQADIDAITKAAGFIEDKVLPKMPMYKELGGLLNPNASDNDEDEFTNSDFSKATDYDKRIRAINMKSSLNSWIASDPVISKHKPGDVITVFNSLSSLSPRLNDRPELMRAVLRRQLELGHIDPFEAGQLIDTETKIKKLDQPGE